MKMRWFLLVLVLLLSLTGCGVPPDTGPDGDLVPSDAEVPPQGDVPSMTQTSIEPGMQPLVDMARQDLALRLSISVDEIDLIEAKSVVWPDSSLGCPQPGMAYLQVPQDGALIILQANGLDYEYHNGGNRGLFLCERTYKDQTPPPQIDLFNLTPSNPNSDAATPDNSIPPGEDQ